MKLQSKLSRMSVQEFDYVVLRKDANWKIAQVVRKKPVWMNKMKFCLDGVVGQVFGSTFQIRDGQLVRLDARDMDAEDPDCDKDAAAERDNRNLVDDADNQRMSKEEIQILRKQGISGQEIVDQLIENSATFNSKTEFAQQKYIKKKKRKHVALLTVLKANTRNLLELYYSRGPRKICQLRMDSLAQILAQANVHAGCRAMVVESCSGLVLGASLERMAGLGSLVHLYTGTAPNRPALRDGFCLEESQVSNLYSFPLAEVNTLAAQRRLSINTFLALPGMSSSALPSGISEHTQPPIIVDAKPVSLHENEPQRNQASEMKIVTETCPRSEACVAEKQQQELFAGHKDCRSTLSDEARTSSRSKNRKGRKRGAAEADRNAPAAEDPEEREKRRIMRRQQIEQAKSVIEAANMDCLVVATKFYPSPIVLSLIDFVAPSRPIVVFSPDLQPLLDCYTKLKERGGVLMLKLSETWLRGYQILPDRTHPNINMSGSGGYLLTAMTVAMEEN